jgi:hypothetical protein
MNPSIMTPLGLLSIMIEIEPDEQRAILARKIFVLGNKIEALKKKLSHNAPENKKEAWMKEWEAVFDEYEKIEAQLCELGI